MPQTNRTVPGVLGGFLGLVGLSAVAGILVTATITPAIAVTGTAASQAIGLFDSLPSYLKVEPPMSPSTIYALDSAGNEVQLATFFDQNRAPVSYDEISPLMIDAIVSSEDKNFFEHGGINLGATAKAVIDNLRGSSTRGASTITQQFVKNVLVQECEKGVSLWALVADEQELVAPALEELAVRWGVSEPGLLGRVPVSEDPEEQAAFDAELAELNAYERAVVKYYDRINDCWITYSNASGQEGIQRKVQELRYALQIDKDYPKHEILLGYLNVTNFGGTVYGIEAAANYYFGTSAKDLTINQAATLAGIVQNPNTYRIDDLRVEDCTNCLGDGFSETKVRRDYVLFRLLDDGKITQAEYDAAKAEEIVPGKREPINGCAAAGDNAYFCQYVKSIIENDPAFGETHAERQEALRRGGLKIYTSLDLGVQAAGVQVMRERVPTHRDDMSLGAAGVTVENSTGRVLAMTQNTIFTERDDQRHLPGYSGLVYAADFAHGGSKGFQTGSTYKLFTLIAWLEEDRSLNELVDGSARNDDGTNRIFPTWYCDGQAQSNRTFVQNFANNSGNVGSVISHTSSSLNTGFLAMAVELDHCDINRVAERMGVTFADGSSVTSKNFFSDPIGTKEIAPLAMASAYATIGNGGVYCSPRAIDRVIGPDGEERPVPESHCERVIDADVAAAAAYALAAVINGGTGSGSRTGDGIPQIGKTGTQERRELWMVSATTNTATATWIGNSIGHAPVLDMAYNGVGFTTARHHITRAMQLAANARYGGGSFPGVDARFLRTVYEDIPNDIIGMNVIEATEALKELGFAVRVAQTKVDSALPEDLVAEHTPGPGQAVKGTQVTLHLSNGMGVEVPSLGPGLTRQQARTFLMGVGFTNVSYGECTEVDVLEEVIPTTLATGTNPAAGAVIAKNAPLAILYRANSCP